MPVSIRAGAPADAAGIARVQTLGWQQGFSGLLPADWLAARVVEPAVWSERIASPLPRSALFVAEVDEEVVGFSLVGPAEPAPGTGQLFALYLLAEHWGRGFGHALHQAGVEALVGQGYERAILWVLPANDRAIAFYRAHGWRDDHEEVTQDVGGLVVPVLRLSHDLRLDGG